MSDSIYFEKFTDALTGVDQYVNPKHVMAFELDVTTSFTKLYLLPGATLLVKEDVDTVWNLLERGRA